MAVPCCAGRAFNADQAIVRGYLAGSAWKEYKELQEADPYAVSINLHGMILPPDMMEWQELPRPFFTPSTKADIGQHDENISAEEARELAGYIDGVGIEYFSLRLYQWAREYAQARGIIITDTKFELFRLPDGSLMLGDEVLTPDSSRFNPLDLYEPGESQPSFDKQFVRDYLQYLCDMGEWDKTYPARSFRLRSSRRRRRSIAKHTGELPVVNSLRVVPS